MRTGPDAPTVALVVDHPRRDLPGLVLVAMALARAGATCHLVPLAHQHRELFALAPDVAVLNYARHGNAALAEALHAAGIGVAVLDTEGGVWATPEHYAELLWRDPTLRAIAAPVCLWGPRLAEYLVAGRLFDAARLRVTGSPRHDLYQPPWSALWDGTLPGDGGPRVLLNTNFTVTNPRFASAEANRRQFVGQYAWDEARTSAVATAEVAAIDAFVALARALDAALPGCTIVLRPHPFEDPDRYARALADTGVVVNAEGPVQPQILAASAVVQRGCSTAIEAALAGVPALSPRWIPAPIEIGMAEAVSEPCADLETMIGRLRAILGGARRGPPAVAAAADVVLRDWFSAQDGEAHRRVTAAILEHLPARRRVHEGRCRRALYGVGEPAISRGARLSRHARRLLGVPPSLSLTRLRLEPTDAWRASDKGFAVDTVAPIMRSLVAADSGGAVVARASTEGHYRARHRGTSVTLAAGSP